VADDANAGLEEYGGYIQGDYIEEYFALSVVVSLRRNSGAGVPAVPYPCM
jgi:hypothetical protein